MYRKFHFTATCICVMVALCSSLALIPLSGQEKKPAKELKHMEVDLGGGIKMKVHGPWAARVDFAVRVGR